MSNKWKDSRGAMARCRDIDILIYSVRTKASNTEYWKCSNNKFELDSTYTQSECKRC